jgi:glycosyltransferase involved in cell wall biosynthesis
MTARRTTSGERAIAGDELEPAAVKVEWPAVTVVIPTHNRHELMAAAVRSVLAQDYPGPVECIVVFDGEEPFQPPVVIPKDRELRVITNDRTPGPAGAYNAGVMAATSELVAFLDDDDEWLRSKLRLQVQALQAHPQSSVAVTGIYLGTGWRSARIPGRELMTLEYLLRGRRIEVHSSSVMVRRSSYLGEIGLIDEAIPGSYGEDYDWHLRAARRAPLVAVQKPLVRVRWQYSYFVDRWRTIIEGLQYQLGHRPEISEHPRNLARIYGRIAFAYAASGEPAQARKWAGRCIKTDWRELRAYLAFLVSYRILRPEFVVRVAHGAGRGV